MTKGVIGELHLAPLAPHTHTHTRTHTRTHTHTHTHIHTHAHTHLAPLDKGHLGLL